MVSLCVLLAFGSGFLMVRDLNQYTKSAGAYDELAENVELPEPAEASEETAGGAETDGEDSGVILPVVDFEALKKNGPDIIGWITLPDSAINYPVTQTDNNEYYLRHLYDGTYNKAGCLFADYENQADFQTAIPLSTATICGMAPCSPCSINMTDSLILIPTGRCTL